MILAETVLFGRKNQTTQPGIVLTIQTDDDGYIQFQRGHEGNVIFKYEMSAIGLIPETQYFACDFKRLNIHSRKLKLQKIFNM